MIVAGADQPRPPPRTKDKLLVQRTGQLMYELSRLYPAISGVMPAYGWDLPLAVTADGVMYAGPHRNYPHHLFAWATRARPGPGVSRQPHPAAPLPRASRTGRCVLRVYAR